MKNCIIFVAILSLLLSLLSCRNECKSDYWYVCRNSTELKKYSFKEGSYWVYRDSITGDIDSESVTGYTAQNHVFISYGHTADGSQCPAYADMVTMIFASYINGSFFYNRNIEDHCGEYYFRDSARGVSFNDVYYYSAGATDSFRNFSVGPFTFPRVLHSHILEYPTTYNRTADYYWADSIGMVKRVTSDSSGTRNWVLQQYHVINP